MDILLHDLRQAFRSLFQNRAVTAAALLTLGLGIGANTAIFSVVYGVLLRPLPYAAPDEIVRIAEEHPGANAPVSGLLSDLTYWLWTPGMRSLESIAAWSDSTFTVGREDPERLRGAPVSPELFSLLRIAPAAGRFFSSDEAEEGADDVVVIGHGLWQERFGGSAGALGQSLVIDDRPRTIVGVAPPGFAFPSEETILWTPYVMPQTPVDEENRGMRVFGAIGRLAAGATPEQAEAEGTAAARGVERPFVANLLFGEGGEVEVRVTRLAEEMTAEVRPALTVLGAAVGLVLLIACANVANLLLTRGLARSRELAVRSALGASRGRLVRLLLTESLLLALAGGAVGWLMAEGLIEVLPALAPENFPRLDDVRLDGLALAFAAVIATVAGVGSGLVPALRSSYGTEPALRDGDLRSTAAGGRRVRAGLLAAEAALAVVLVVGAGLLARSFVSMAGVDAGYDPRNVLMGQLHFGGSDREPERTAEVVENLLARLRARADVTAAGAANMAPFGRSTSISGFRIPAENPDAEPRPVRANTWVVTPGLDRALGLRLVEGRFIEESDADSGIQAMVVNEEFVRMFLDDGEPVIGRRYDGLITEQGIFTEVVGVVANVLKDGPTLAPQPEIYVPRGGFGRAFAGSAFVFVRTTGDPLGMVPEVREMLRQGAPLTAFDGTGSLAGRVSTALAQPRFAAAVLGAFALLALVLAATGLYGVMSYTVSQRRREMGIRAALGASRSGILRLVMREGLAKVAWGLALGLAAAAFVTRLMQGLLFGVEPLDPVSFAIAPIALLAVGVIACLVPARRATSVDPAGALRAE